MLLHKCTAAHKLISSLEQIIADARSERTYPKWSDEFLTFCEQTSHKTSDCLKEWLLSHGQGNLPKEILSERLSSIIQGWEALHSFIKPVLDADNLRVPYPLVHLLSDHIGDLETVKGAKFVTEISPELNYFQHQHTGLRRTLVDLQAIVHGPPVEPALGFLALPCSQSNGLFMNCLLYHEAGHFIAEETGSRSESELIKLSNELEPRFKKWRWWAAAKIRRLMEELFADLVAVKLVGIGYTLSYMELLRLVTDDWVGGAKRFFVDHPADALRFREQFKILNDDGWDDYAKSLPQWEELERMAEVAEEDYLVPKEYQGDPEMKEIWCMLRESLCEKDRIDRLHNQVAAVTQDREDPCECYGKFAKAIKECLSHGIVPSAGKAGQIPHPVAVINGGVLFWLSGMGQLYETVPSRKKEEIEDRVFLEKRVETWCLKAIENWLITKNQRQAKTDKQAPSLVS